MVVKDGSLGFHGGSSVVLYLVEYLFEIVVFEVDALEIKALALQKEKSTVRDYTTIIQL